MTRGATGVRGRVSKEEAVKRLAAAGFGADSERLASWRNKNGNNWGWDGWVRGNLAHHVDRIWLTGN